VSDLETIREEMTTETQRHRGEEKAKYVPEMRIAFLGTAKS
jgi:hypothetical protein